MTTPHSFAHPDPQRLAALADVSRAWDEKRITLQDARAQLLPLAPIKPWEIALLEQRDTDKDTPDHDCRKVSIDEMLAIYAPYLDRSRPTDLPEDHPIAIYYREIDAWKGVLDEIVDLVQYPVIRNQWYALYDKLAQVKIHFQRKHHQLYSELERRGFDRPSKHMWLFDDYIRNAIRDARSLLEQETPATDEAFIAKQDDILRSCRDLIAKEETVLLPTSLALIPQDAFNVMKLGDAEIGYAWGVAQVKPEAAPAEPTPTSSATPATGLPTGFMQELGALLGKYGLQAGGSTASPDGLLEVKTGKLSLEQINLIFQHLPIDISFVDEDEIVRFYTDTKHRIFPRSRNVIGRRVTNCHPSTSVHFVKEILAKFKSGEEDSVDFWINKPGKFIYILFVAIRDEAGHFRGVMEVMQDCTRIRELTDSRTLLTWSQETKEPTYLHGIAEPGEDVPVGKRRGFSRHPSSDDVPATAPTTAPTVASAPTSEPQVTFTPETRLQTLIDVAPWLRQRLGDEVAHFQMLNTPMGDIMIPRATLGMMSEHSGVPFEALVALLTRLMAEKH